MSEDKGDDMRYQDSNDIPTRTPNPDRCHVCQGKAHSLCKPAFSPFCRCCTTPGYCQTSVGVLDWPVPFLFKIKVQNPTLFVIDRHIKRTINEVFWLVSAQNKYECDSKYSTSNEEKVLNREKRTSCHPRGVH